MRAMLTAEEVADCLFCDPDEVIELMDGEFEDLGVSQLPWKQFLGNSCVEISELESWIKENALRLDLALDQNIRTWRKIR